MWSHTNLALRAVERTYLAWARTTTSRRSPGCPLLRRAGAAAGAGASSSAGSGAPPRRPRPPRAPAPRRASGRLGLGLASLLVQGLELGQLLLLGLGLGLGCLGGLSLRLRVRPEHHVSRGLLGFHVLRRLVDDVGLALGRFGDDVRLGLGRFGDDVGLGLGRFGDDVGLALGGRRRLGCGGAPAGAAAPAPWV